MALKILNIEDEVSCSLCLELLTESLSLDCGHSFCQACITANTKEAEISLEGGSSCPVCSARYSLGNLRPNQHLANIVEKIREIKLNPEELTRDLCERHEEKLRLFCKEDRKIICWLCERSQEHRGHHTFLMEEVIKECQEKLQAALERLRKEQQKAEKLEADIREERISWKYQILAEKQRIQAEFIWLKIILDNEEQRELQMLEEEEKRILDDLAEAEADLAQQNQLVKELISDLELRSEWPTADLLQVGSTASLLTYLGTHIYGLANERPAKMTSPYIAYLFYRSEIWTLRKPQTVSKKLKSSFRAPDLRAMLRMHRELTHVQCYWVDITLNPINLSINLVLSEDQRQVMSMPIWPVRYYNYGIVGSQYFSSGKHYWEIDVSKKTAWILGVYCRTRFCNRKFVVGRGTNHRNLFSRYKPQFGYWVIGLQNKFEYTAFEETSTSDPKVLTLSMAVPPFRVGVFLDYEAGIVSFFNVTNHGSLIYKFSKCRFSRTAYPYFNPLNCPGPMTLCPPSS